MVLVSLEKKELVTHKKSKCITQTQKKTVIDNVKIRLRQVTWRYYVYVTVSQPFHREKNMNTRVYIIYQSIVFRL